MKLCRYLFLFILISLVHITTFAREIQVKSFEILSRDLTARTKRVDDLNGKMCALIKVALPVEDCKFEGDVIQQSFDVNEYLVYMPEGSKRLRIKCPGFETLQVELTTAESVAGVKSGVTYSLKLSGYEDIGTLSKPIDPGANYLILDITPKTGLSVKVDGQLQTVDNGQVMTYLKYGTHSYVVEAEGYAPQEGKAAIGRGDKTTVNITLESVMATLAVRPATNDATIKVNGQEKGIGSWQGQLTPGIYRIDVERSGYRPYSETVELVQRDNKVVSLPALSPIYGALNIGYKPIGAQISIDGKNAGTTPTVISDVLIGRHNITISKEGYSPFNTSVDIVEGQTAQLDGSLQAVSQSSVAVFSKLPANSSGNTINGHEYVDLGLPSGTKWATCNIGASSPSDYGDYFAWGETTTKSGYAKANSKTYKINIGDISNNSKYDAASAKWGGSWRLPTETEWVELNEKCKWTWTTQGGHKGYNVTGPNGKSIFLPAAGSRDKSSLNLAGVLGRYWSSSPHKNKFSYYLGFSSSTHRVSWDNRSLGYTVRPVSNIMALLNGIIIKK